MPVSCDFCSVRTEEENLYKCECLRSFCDECANVVLADDPPSFTTVCSFCPGCSTAEECKAQSAAVVAKPAEPPTEFFCPITQEILLDPVVLTDGFSYERQAVVEWLSHRMISPITGKPVNNALMPNTVLKVLINDWKRLHNIAS